MSQFLQLSPQKSRGLDRIIFNNARRLYKDAIILEKSGGSCCSANSLLILSSEEAIKAILVLLHSEGYRTYGMENAKKFFTDHRMRHQLAKFVELTAGILESFAKYTEQEPVNPIKTQSKGWNDFLNGILRIVNVVGPVIKSTKRIEILEGFNTNKNKGFYVDYFGDPIVPELEINATRYNETKEIVIRIFRVYKACRILFHPSASRRYDPGKVALIKDQLRELINNAMKDFSFTNL